MAESETTHSSLAHELQKAWLTRTSIMRAIAELVAAYVWWVRVEWELLDTLQWTNAWVKGIIKPSWEPMASWVMKAPEAANDDKFKVAA